MADERESETHGRDGEIKRGRLPGANEKELKPLV